MDLQLSNEQCSFAAVLIFLSGKGTKVMNPGGFLVSPCPQLPCPAFSFSLRFDHLPSLLADFLSSLVLLGLAGPVSSSGG